MQTGLAKANHQGAVCMHTGAFLGTRCSKMVRTTYLQVVKNEEERFSGKPLVELHSVGVRWRHLVVERQGGARVPHQVLPAGLTGSECQDLGWTIRTESMALELPVRAGEHFPSEEGIF